jgi:putative membrane protein
MMGWYGGGGMGSFGVGVGVFWLALILLVIWLVVRLLPGSGTTRNTGESALEILDRRLANGQIDFEPWQAQRAAILTARGDRK